MQIPKDLAKHIQEKSISSYSGLESLLRNLNFKCTGNGSYASCFTHKDYNYAVKIFARSRDLAYLSYLKRVIKSDNPYMPKVYSISKKKIGGRIYMIVILEKLINWRDIDADSLENSLFEHFGYTDIYLSYDILHPYFETTNEKLEQLWKILVTVCNDTSFAFDNHKNNIMFRKEDYNYFPVFIDPVFSRNG